MSVEMSSAPPRLPALFRLLWQQTYPEMLRRVSAAGFDDIRLAHWPVLQWPGPDGQRPSVIAERAGTSKQAVNHVLRDLERLGYVELRPDPGDSRARLVQLTARGHTLVEALFDAAAATERELETTLTPGQRSELKKTLTALWQSDVFAASRAADQQAVEPAPDVAVGDVAAAHDEAQ
jgi:DNA-binding MarR family transcriptional regulator